MEPRQPQALYLRRIGNFIRLIRRSVLVRINSEIIRSKLLYAPQMRRRANIIRTKIFGHANNVRLPRTSWARLPTITPGAANATEMMQEQGIGGMLIEEPSGRFRRVSTWAIGITVLAAAALVVYSVFFVDGEVAATESTVERVTVERGELTTTLTTSGTAAAGASSQLTFAAGGQVVAVEAGIGDQVMKGQVVARLDETEAQRRLQTAETNLEQAKLRLRQMEEPPADEEIAAARQMNAAARSQLVSAELSLAARPRNTVGECLGV